MDGAVSDEEDREIVAEAKRRWKAADDWESQANMLGDQDVKFGNADSDNQWQWPDDIRRELQAANHVILTINKTRQHCLQIINDARQNKAGIQVRPTGGGASFKSAETIEGIVRHVEYISNAQQAYDNATWWQVFGGIGYWRVITDYVSDDNFDEQEIYIRRIPNPRTVRLDPDIREYDGSDANWGFVFEDIARDEAISQGIIDKNETVVDALDTGGGNWNTRENVRRAEYFRKSHKKDELIELPPEFAQMFGVSSVRKSEMPDDLKAMIPADARRRSILTPEIEWFKIVGENITDRKIWPGKYIPIVRCVGEETVIDGQLDRKGHVRALKDPQRTLNYNTAAATQYGALQTKTPWLAPIEAIEGIEHWQDSNISTALVLPYHGMDDNGNQIEKPMRIEPPVAAPVFMEGIKMAQQELMLASGQYQAIMGAPSNETSGKAINARQRQGDNATYHYIDHLASAIRFTGRIIIDLIPHIYDTKRVKQIIGLDGKQQAIQIDPEATDAHQQVQDADSKDADPDGVMAIFNPAVGEYDVMADVGPSYQTQRQEAFNAFTQIIQSNPDLVHIIGDLMFLAADFPMANLIAQRLKNMVPQQALGGPPVEQQQMMQHVQAAAQAGQEQIEQLHTELQKTKMELASKQWDQQLDLYRAETERQKALGAIDPEAFKPVIRSMISDLLGMPVVPLMHAHALAEQAMMPPEEEEGVSADGG